MGSRSRATTAPRSGSSSDIISQLAKRFNLSEEQASNGLAQVLPELVNQMTPQGAVPGDQHDMISDALRQLAPHT